MCDSRGPARRTRIDQLALGGDYQLNSHFDLAQIDLDPLLAAALHIAAITGHGQADGQISVNGSLLHPETLIVGADLSHYLFMGIR